jgi:hypothetical protein
MSAADQVSGSGNSSDRASPQKGPNLFNMRNCYRYTSRSARVTREVARKTAARITLRTLESRMPLTGAAREFLDRQKVTAFNRPARGQSCTNATYDAGHDPGEARTSARFDVSAGASLLDVIGISINLVPTEPRRKRQCRAHIARRMPSGNARSLSKAVHVQLLSSVLFLNVSAVSSAVEGRAIACERKFPSQQIRNKCQQTGHSSAKQRWYGMGCELYELREAFLSTIGEKVLWPASVSIPLPILISVGFGDLVVGIEALTSAAAGRHVSAWNLRRLSAPSPGVRRLDRVHFGFPSEEAGNG